MKRRLAARFGFIVGLMAQLLAVTPPILLPVGKVIHRLDPIFETSVKDYCLRILSIN